MSNEIQHRFDLYYNGIKKAELSQIKSINWGYKRNDFVGCSFVYNANDISQEVLQNLVTGAELKIYRKKSYGEDLELIYTGEIQVGDKSINENNEKTINAEVTPWGTIFFTTRFITKSYTNTEEEDIAWDVINETQTDTYGGTLTTDQVNWGITRGTETATDNPRDRQYEDDELLTLFQQLADVEDVEPNPQRLRGFRLTPDLTDHRENYWQWQAEYGTLKNVTYTNDSIKRIREVKSIKNLINKVIANGKDSLQEAAISDDENNLNFYKLRVGFISKTNISTSGALQDAAVDEVTVRQDPPKIYSIDLIENDPFVGEYRVGDFIRIRYEDPEDGFINVDDIFQVYAIDLSLDENGVESASIVIAQNKPITTATDISEKLVENIKKTDNRLTNLEK